MGVATKILFKGCKVLQNFVCLNTAIVDPPTDDAGSAPETMLYRVNMIEFLFCREKS